jgi:archaellum component FlaC
LDDMPADEVALRRIHSELIDIQNDIQRNNNAFDQLNGDVTKVRRVVEKTRPKQATHSDVTRLEDDVKNLTRRWENCANQLIERYYL